MGPQKKKEKKKTSTATLFNKKKIQMK